MRASETAKGDYHDPLVKAVTQAQREQFIAALDLLANKVTEDEVRIGVAFPYVTKPDGSWDCMSASRSAGYHASGWDHGNWFCGFWVGLLLLSYLHRGDQRFLEIARERMRLVAQRAEDPNTHDIGFIFSSSAVPGHHITRKSWWAEFAVRAANQLRARLVPTRTGAYISAWGLLTDQRGRASSAIDTMANLPLLYWAARQTGDSSFTAAGEAHAVMTRGAFIRPDLSTYHAVEYDVMTGTRRRGFTFQGYANESCWSRGQSWAVLGYAATAEATGDLKYLNLACSLADYFLDRLGAQALPPWDFDDPAGAAATRDSSAAAILARALLSIASLHPDAGERRKRTTQAADLLEKLCNSALAREPQHRGLLKHACYSLPHRQGTDSAVLFGDFYFAEALSLILMPGRFGPPAGAPLHGVEGRSAPQQISTDGGVRQPPRRWPPLAGRVVQDQGVCEPILA